MHYCKVELLTTLCKAAMSGEMFCAENNHSHNFEKTVQIIDVTCSSASKTMYIAVLVNFRRVEWPGIICCGAQGMGRGRRSRPKSYTPQRVVLRPNYALL